MKETKNKIKTRNIPIEQTLLNKYNNVKELFSNEANNYNNITKINLIDINFKCKNATEIYHIATEIFKNNHNKNTFVNNENQIKVTNQDIKESVNIFLMIDYKIII